MYGCVFFIIKIKQSIWTKLFYFIQKCVRWLFYEQWFIVWYFFLNLWETKNIAIYTSLPYVIWPFFKIVYRPISFSTRHMSLNQWKCQTVVGYALNRKIYALLFSTFFVDADHFFFQCSFPLCCTIFLTVE